MQEQKNSVHSPDSLALCDRIIQYVLFSLVKELREAEFDGQLSALSSTIQFALAFAMRSAITEIRVYVLEDEMANDPDARNWEVKMLGWACASVFGSEEIDKMRRFVEISDDPKSPFSPFSLCGTSLARSVVSAVSNDVTMDDWLESRCGMFMSMYRLITPETSSFVEPWK